jgi:cyclopropane fatty-acyl-phospholipid synthase-like methyltransferase
VSLARFVAFADLPEGSRLLDAGCGPGLVAEAFLDARCQVLGVDLSSEMIRRARQRCARFGERARFEQKSLHDLTGEQFDAALSRNVLHHVEDPASFVRAQAALVRRGGVVLANDIIADPDPERRRWAHQIERARDRTHTRTLTPGELVDLFAGAELVDVRLVEEGVELDYDEWFDRGTPDEPKETVKARLVQGTARGFAPERRMDGGISIRVLRAVLRGVKPG